MIQPMRFADLARDCWALRSGEDSHAPSPDSFWIPEEAQRRSLGVGQAAKLIFDIEAEDPAGNSSLGGERMWVIVSEVGRDFYIGIPDSQPESIETSDSVYLRFGAEIPFGPQHVIDIGEPPQDYVDWQLGQEPEVRWPGRDDAE